MLWPRVWQMACRLEEIPKVGDFVEYEILDDSIIVVRVDSQNVRAYYNACRHRGVKLVEGNGSRRTFVCPFHGWCWGIDGRNTFVLRPEEFAEENMCPEDLQLVSVRCELWAGAPGSTSTITISIGYSSAGATSMEYSYHAKAVFLGSIIDERKVPLCMTSFSSTIAAGQMVYELHISVEAL